MSGLVAGLCSISFRELSADEVLALAARAGLGAIEWGADRHARPDDPAALRELAKRCGDAGIACASYGTYHFAGHSDPAGLPALLDGAQALGASTVRVWAAMGVAPDAGEAERRPIADALAAAIEIARVRGLDLGVEFHPGTLTETAASALALLRDAGPARAYSYWQPAPGASEADSLAELDTVLPHLAHLHVFSWDPDPQHRRPLAHLETMWRAALARASSAVTAFEPRCAYLEYLPDDAPEALLRDGACLSRWIAEVQA